MNSKMSTEAKDFFRRAVKDGKVYTTPIHSIGVTYSKAINQVTIENPYGDLNKKKRKYTGLLYATAALLISLISVVSTMIV